MRITMQFPLGKRIGRTEMAPISGLSSSHRLFIKDKISGLKYLVDTGAEVSVLPPSRVSARCPSAIQLHAANGTMIKTYGQRLLNVDIGLRRQFPWVFLVADVQQPILGADFLTNFSLQVDLSSKRLLDSSSNLSINACSVFTTDPSCTAISLMPLSLPTDFSYLLKQFPTVTQPCRYDCPVEHSVSQNLPVVGAPAGITAPSTKPLTQTVIRYLTYRILLTDFMARKYSRKLI